MLLAVNYHYVGMLSYPYSGIYGLSEEVFLSQIHWLRKNFHLISPEDLLSASEKGLPERACLITFDDGLKCHYRIVAPLMEKYDFKCGFFVSGKPLREKKANFIHMNHYLRANTEPTLLRGKIEEYASSIGYSLKSVSPEEAREHYRYDEIETARIKYLVNYVMPLEESQNMTSTLFYEIVMDEKKFCEDWYLSCDEVKELHDKFQCIGSHAYSHSPLSQMSKSEVSIELEESREILNRITGDKISIFSYPLGNENAVGRREGVLAKEAGFKYAFTMEREVNQTLEDPLLLARIDCNDLPQIGKKPFFIVEKGRLMKEGQRNPSCRKRYFIEQLEEGVCL